MQYARAASQSEAASSDLLFPFWCPGWESFSSNLFLLQSNKEICFLRSHKLLLEPMAQKFCSIPTPFAVYPKTGTKPVFGYTVPGVGIEPTWSCGHKILSLARLPISPPGHERHSTPWCSIFRVHHALTLILIRTVVRVNIKAIY